MSTDDDEENEAQDESLSVRDDLGAAYSFIVGRESVRSFSTYTFEEAMQDQLERLTKGTATRPCERNRIDALESRVKRVIERIRGLPPDAFNHQDAKKDVNTPEEGDD